MVLLSGLVLVATGFTLPGAMPTETPARAAVSMNFFAGLQQGLAKAMAGNYDEAAVKANLERQIKMKPAILYGTTTCPFCAKAQEEITSMGAILSVYAFDEEEEGPAMKAELMKIGLQGVYLVECVSHIGYQKLQQPVTILDGRGCPPTLTAPPPGGVGSSWDLRFKENAS